jgi:hypothetical protein
MEFEGRFARALAAGLVAVLVPVAATAQENAEPKAPLEAAFSKIARSWLERTVPDPQVFARPERAADFTAAASLFAQRRPTFASVGRLDRQSFRLGRRQKEGAAAAWEFDPVRASLFGNILDPKLTGRTGPVDIRAQARAYLRQQIVQNILGRSAFGRGLSLFIDTGQPTWDPNQTTRSRLLPYLSPEVDIAEGKAALTFIWKF